MKIWLLLMLALFSSVTLRAEQKPKTAEDLLKGCEFALLLAQGKKLNAKEIALAAGATSYLDGYVDAIAMSQRLHPELKLIHLPPDGPKLGAYMREIAGLIRGNPELRRGGTARVAAMLALKKHHPPR